MKRLAIIALGAALAGSASAQLFNNGTGRGALEPLGMGTNVRPEGGWFSRLQGNQSTFGATSTGAFYLADDFTVTGPGWNITGASVFGYQTNATTVVINDATVAIWDKTGAGGNPGNLLHVGTFTGASFTDIYRVTSTTTDTARRVQQANVSFSNVTLNPGEYWLVFQFAVGGTGAFFTPQITTPGQTQATGSTNGLQFNANTGVWTQLVDSGSGTPYDVPFVLQGAPVPEPATMAALGLGALAVMRRRRRK
jgi:hypothetical protein